MVGEACLPSNAYYPRMPDYTLCSGVHVCWSEHSDSSFVYGFMSLDYGFGTMTATTCSLVSWNQNILPLEVLDLVLVLLFVALWFILRGDLLCVFPCVVLFLCFSVLLVLRLPRLGEVGAGLGAFRAFVRFVLV